MHLPAVFSGSGAAIPKKRDALTYKRRWRPTAAPPIVDVVPLGGGLPQLGLLGPLRPGRSAFTKGYAGTRRSAPGTEGAAVLLSGRRPLSLPRANSERLRHHQGDRSRNRRAAASERGAAALLFRRGRFRTGSHRGGSRRGGARARRPEATKRPEWPARRGR